MKSVHEVLIVPALGRCDAHGAYVRGHVVGSMSQLDVIDRYTVALRDELENAGIRVRTLETRKPPGTAFDQRHVGILANTLILHCSIGWFDAADKMPPQNRSRILLGLQESNELANLVSEAIHHWGQIYCDFHHQGRKPIVNTKDPLLTVADTLAVGIEPFLLNGPNHNAYLLKLEELGHDIGRAISDYVLKLSLGAKIAGTNFDHLPKRTPGHKIAR